jgi:hypothetical protein
MPVAVRDRGRRLTVISASDGRGVARGQSVVEHRFDQAVTQGQRIRRRYLERRQFARRLKMPSLILKRASASRPSCEWSYEDFDVLADGAVVGRIMKVFAAPEGTPWMRTLAFGHHEARTPTHGYHQRRKPTQHDRR